MSKQLEIDFRTDCEPSKFCTVVLQEQLAKDFVAAVKKARLYGLKIPAVYAHELRALETVALIVEDEIPHARRNVQL